MPFEQSNRKDDQFATTRWSLVISAAGNSDSKSQEALETLCEAYWLPLYAYARKRVANVDDAQDLTQAFFERLLEKNYLAEADRNRGHFRSFLITSFKHFLSNEWKRARAAKRGGGRAPLTLDFQVGDSHLEHEAVTSLTPEQTYQRQWANTLLQRVLDQLQAEHDQSGKATQFQELKGLIIGQSDIKYADVAAKIGTTEAAAKMKVQRLRQRYRQKLREEVANLVSTPDEIDAEIQGLFEVFRA